MALNSWDEWTKSGSPFTVGNTTYTPGADGSFHVSNPTSWWGERDIAAPTGGWTTENIANSSFANTGWQNGLGGSPTPIYNPQTGAVTNRTQPTVTATIPNTPAPQPHTSGMENNYPTVRLGDYTYTRDPATGHYFYDGTDTGYWPNLTTGELYTRDSNGNQVSSGYRVDGSGNVVLLNTQPPVQTTPTPTSPPSTQPPAQTGQTQPTSQGVTLNYNGQPYTFDSNGEFQSQWGTYSLGANNSVLLNGNPVGHYDAAGNVTALSPGLGVASGIDNPDNYNQFRNMSLADFSSLYPDTSFDSDQYRKTSLSNIEKTAKDLSNYIIGGLAAKGQINSTIGRDILANGMGEYMTGALVDLENAIMKEQTANAQQNWSNRNAQIGMYNKSRESEVGNEVNQGVFRSNYQSPFGNTTVSYYGVDYTLGGDGQFYDTDGTPTGYYKGNGNTITYNGNVVGQWDPNGVVTSWP